MERTITPEQLKATLTTTLVLDVRRESDYGASGEVIPGSLWKNPEQIDQWIDAVPRNHEVVIYCARGGSVSNGVVDRLQGAGVRARFIEGGIEGWKTAGGRIVPKGNG